MFINFDFVVDFSGANGNGHQRTAMVRFIMPELELGTMVEVMVFFDGDGWLIVFFLVKMVLELGGGEDFLFHFENGGNLSEIYKNSGRIASSPSEFFQISKR